MAYSLWLIAFGETIKSNQQSRTIMDKGKIVAIITGVISILIAIAYLVVVQLIDFRGEMIPAPVDQLSIINYLLTNLTLN
jgi:hypothetical protein